MGPPVVDSQGRIYQYQAFQDRIPYVYNITQYSSTLLLLSAFNTSRGTSGYGGFIGVNASNFVFTSSATSPLNSVFIYNTQGRPSGSFPATVESVWLAVDSLGNILLSNSTALNQYSLSSTGQYRLIRTFPYSYIQGLYVASDGLVYILQYVSDPASPVLLNNIVVLAVNGTQLASFNIPYVSSGVISLAVDDLGIIYVGAYRTFSAYSGIKGAPNLGIFSNATSSPSPSAYSSSSSSAASPTSAFVTSSLSAGTQPVVSGPGTLLHSYTTGNGSTFPGSVYVSLLPSGALIISDVSGQRLLVQSINGTLLSSLRLPTSLVGQPAVDSAGRIYQWQELYYPITYTIAQYSSTLQPLSVISAPYGSPVALNASNFLFAQNFAGMQGSIVVYNPQFRQVATTYGPGVGYFMAVDSLGNVLLTDGNAVYQYSLNASNAYALTQTFNYSAVKGLYVAGDGLIYILRSLPTPTTVDSVIVLAPNGTQIANISLPAVAYSFQSVAVDAQGLIYVGSVPNTFAGGLGGVYVFQGIKGAVDPSIFSQNATITLSSSSSSAPAFPSSTSSATPASSASSSSSLPPAATSSTGVQFTPAAPGILLHTYTSSGNISFAGTVYVSLLPSGALVLADLPNSRLVTQAINGTLLSSVRVPATSAGPPVVDSSGRIYQYQAFQSTLPYVFRIAQYSPTLQPLVNISTVYGGFIGVNASNSVFANTYTSPLDTVQIYTSLGVPVGSFPATVESDWMTVDSLGNILLANTTGLNQYSLSATGQYRLTRTFPYTRVEGLYVASDGLVYMLLLLPAVGFQQAIVVLAANGTQLANFSIPYVYAAQSLAVDDLGIIYVGSSQGVYAFTGLKGAPNSAIFGVSAAAPPSSSSSSSLPPPAVSSSTGAQVAQAAPGTLLHTYTGTGGTAFASNVFVSLLPSGALVLADLQSSRLVTQAINGTLLSSVRLTPTNAGPLVVDSFGRVYQYQEYLSSAVYSIAQYSSSLQSLANISTVYGGFVGVNASNFLFANTISSQDSVQIYTPQGVPAGSFPATLGNNWLAVDSLGNILLSNNTALNQYSLSSTGQYRLTRTFSYPTYPYPSSPSVRGLYVASDGLVYILLAPPSSPLLSLIIVLSANGTAIANFTFPYIPAAQSLAVDDLGIIYVGATRRVDAYTGLKGAPDSAIFGPNTTASLSSSSSSSSSSGAARLSSSSSSAAAQPLTSGPGTLLYTYTSSPVTGRAFSGSVYVSAQPSGALVINEPNNLQLETQTINGTLLNSVRIPLSSTPAVDSTGRVYLGQASGSTYSVLVYSPALQLLSTIPLPAYDTAVAVNATGFIFALTFPTSSTAVVLVLDPQGRAAGNFSVPYSSAWMAVDAAGNVLVGSQSTLQQYSLSPTGQYTVTRQTVYILAGIKGLFVAGGLTYVLLLPSTAQYANTIIVLAANGTQLANFTYTAAGAYATQSLAVDNLGLIYIGSSGYIYVVQGLSGAPNPAVFLQNATALLTSSSSSSSLASSSAVLLLGSSSSSPAASISPSSSTGVTRLSSSAVSASSSTGGLALTGAGTLVHTYTSSGGTNFGLVLVSLQPSGALVVADSSGPRLLTQTINGTLLSSARLPTGSFGAPAVDSAGRIYQWQLFPNAVNAIAEYSSTLQSVANISVISGSPVAVNGSGFVFYDASTVSGNTVLIFDAQGRPVGNFTGPGVRSTWMAVDSLGNVLLANDTAVSQYSPSTTAAYALTRTFSYSSVSGLYVAGDGLIYIMQSAGVFSVSFVIVLSPDGTQIANITLPAVAYSLYSLAVDARGLIYVGSVPITLVGGVYVFQGIKGAVDPSIFSQNATAPLASSLSSSSTPTPLSALSSSSPAASISPSSSTAVARISSSSAALSSSIVPSSSSSSSSVPSAASSSSSSSSGVSRPSSVLGDPAFVGLLGQQYQVHGLAGSVYSLISDAEVQVNSRFTFLQSAECVRDSEGVPLFVCHSHAGSYLQSLAVRTAAGHRVWLSSGSAVQGFSAVTVRMAGQMASNRSLSVGESVKMGGGPTPSASRGQLEVRFIDLRTVAVLHAGVFSLVVQNSDSFLNLLSLSVDDGQWSRVRRQLQPHGLLGQTWQRRADKGKEVAEVEGYVDDYAERAGDMFGCGTLFNKFECRSDVTNAAVV